METNHNGSKLFTEAQKRRLTALIEQAQSAKRELDGFVVYLQDEYDASPKEGWMIGDVEKGFVKREVAHADDSPA